MPAERPDRNVFILGAGFSAGAGAPVIRDFLDVSRELFDDPDSGLDPEERQLFEKVFDFKKKVARAREKFEIDLDNIEELFGLVEMSHRLSPDAADTRDATVYLIAKTLQLAIERHPDKPRIGLTPHNNYRTVTLPWHSLVPRDQGSDRFLCGIYQHFAYLLAGMYDDPHRSASRSNVAISFNYDLSP
jgi:hypothetical protein